MIEIGSPPTSMRAKSSTSVQFNTGVLGDVRLLESRIIILNLFWYRCAGIVSYADAEYVINLGKRP